jgi:hypothetical protein
MHLVVKKLDLLWDGYLPRDSMAGDQYRQVFCHAKPLIDHAFKVERPAFVRTWWFDRYFANVIDLRNGPFPTRGKFYSVERLFSETDRAVAYYLMELGWQVRLTMHSIERQEFITLAVFSGQGALLQENQEYSLQTLSAQEAIPEHRVPSYA